MFRANRLLSAACLVTTAMTVGGPVLADDFEPFIVGALLLELEDDLVVAASDPADEFNSLYPTGELVTVIGLAPHVSVDLGLTFQPVVDPTGDNAFADLGLYARAADIRFHLDGLELFAGKFEPRFGRAWDITPGLYGNDIATDYQLIEMVGLGGTFAIEAGRAGTHVFGASAFFADTTVLSQSLFTNRGRLTLADGGPANTGRLDNFTLTLDGSDIAAAPGLSYNLGITGLSAGRGDLADQTGFVFGLTNTFDVTPGVQLTLNGEIAHFNNLGGTLDDGTYTTVGAMLSRGSWQGVIAGTVLHRSLAGGGSDTTSLLQFSGGYEFASGLALTVGYAYENEAGESSHTVGFELTRQFDFATRGAPEIDFDITDPPLRGDSAVIPR